MSATIPVIDYRDHLAGGERAATFTQALGEALEATGFVAITHHGLPTGLLDRAYQAARDVFALPEAVKQRYETPEDGRQRGYTSFGVEHAKDQAAPDLKEFWHVGRELPAEHALRQSGNVPPNLFPAEVPSFGDALSELFDNQDRFANSLLACLGEYLGQPEGTFEQLVRDGNSVLRVIHYPDQLGQVPAGAVRAAEHEDINLITILPASTRPGLQILTREGAWLPVMTPPDVMICDTGDMMQLLTAGRLPATTHRVVNPEGADGGRLSMPFFLHPNPERMLVPFFEGGAEPISVKDFFFDRLRAIGVA